MENITNTVLKPMQFKMSTGSVYAGFPGEVDEFGMMEVLGACSIAFIRSESRYEINGLLTSTHPLGLGLSCVQLRQEIIDETDSALAYSRYLSALVANLSAYGEPVPFVFNQYIDYINPYFMSQCEGVELRVIGKYDYAMGIGDSDLAKDYQQQMIRMKRAYNDKSLTVEEKSCQPNVVHLQFGSRSNASEKSED